MLGIKDLKERIKITENTVECPVKDCGEIVKRQRGVFKNEDRFRCPKHKIVISPTTFEYPCKLDNLLWKESTDLELLRRIEVEKRESRMARDNSEDAVTWNVFRYLERNDLVDGFLSNMAGMSIRSSEVIYWSYNQKEDTAWSPLEGARQEFGEKEKRGSEPDIIVKTDKTLFFIEAKLTASNKTEPSDKSHSKKYENGGDNWFSKVFKTNYREVAKEEKKYELMRFWLLGTWIAKKQGLDFYLINLVLSEREPCIEEVFRQHIDENERRHFRRLTWESIYECILKASLIKDKEIMLNYFRNKTIGYENRKLQRAFSIPDNIP